MNLLYRYRHNLLRNRSSAVKRTVRLCTLDTIQKVGVLWCEEDGKAFTYLQEIFREHKVIVRNLCFTNDKANQDSSRFSSKDLNWLGFPQGGNIDTFISADFDILLNISVVPNFAFEVITALSAASLKIGWDRDKLGFLDISVDVSKKPDALYLAEQQIFYLKQLNKNTNL